MSEKLQLTVTIGIPAYNEERNIAKLIRDIRAQKKESFEIENIFVVSDGSTDQTVFEASKSKRVTVLSDGKRRGKALRINEIFQLAQSELVIILDADISLTENAIEQLIQPFFTSPDTMLVSGSLAPIAPKTIAGRLSYVAYYLWESAIELAKNAEVYHCSGPMRAFRKAFYKNFVFPSITADDVYPYFVCKQMGYRFNFIKGPLGFYKLPATIVDFKKQQQRFLESESVQEEIFGINLVKREYTITFFIKALAFVKTFFKFPTATLCYLLVWIPIKIKSLISHPDIKGTWDPVVSTK